jgi:site-specific recombinase XerD
LVRRRRPLPRPHPRQPVRVRRRPARRRRRTVHGTLPTTRHAALLGWLAEEGEIDRDELLGAKAPKLDQKVVEPLTDAQIKAMLAACSGTGNQFWDRRDEALIRFMVETGCRAGEVAVMQLPDLDLATGVAIVRRGKGGKGRSVPFGPQTAKAIDRYVHSRRTHRLASTPALRLGDRGKPFGYDGLHKTLRFRAETAGIAGFHPHRLRHTAAHR